MNAGNRPGYFKDWYDGNKDGLAEKRKAKYRGDPEHRAKTIQSSRDYRRRVAANRVHVPRYSRPLVKKTGSGSKIELYTVGAFAMVVGRSIQAINNWQARGLLPVTPYLRKRGDREVRYYTMAMAEAVKEVIGSKRRLLPADPKMHGAIIRKWKALGVPVGCTEGLAEALKLTT